jgi:hypothetical protein
MILGYCIASYSVALQVEDRVGALKAQLETAQQEQRNLNDQVKHACGI